MNSVRKKTSLFLLVSISRLLVLGRRPICMLNLKTYRHCKKNFTTPLQCTIHFETLELSIGIDATAISKFQNEQPPTDDGMLSGGCGMAGRLIHSYARVETRRGGKCPSQDVSSLLLLQ
jgi:hypothetical protein